MTDTINLGIDGLGPATFVDRGGSAYVYLAEQLAFGRKVAVKVLFQALEDPTTRRRFERECRAIGAVSDHPNIVVVHGRGLTEDDRPYLVMEHRQGGSLADRLKNRGRLTEGETIQIGIKIARALHVAHGAGVIHRDVKPGNILLSKYGEPALADFGIARMEGASKTTAGILTASVNHASREVLSGEETTIQSDVYSLGSTLFTLVTGRPPFVDPSDDSVWTLIDRVVTTDPPNPETFGVNSPLASVLQSALSHDLSLRYQDAAELRQALEELVDRGGTATSRSADTKQFPITAATTSTPKAQQPPKSPVSGSGPVAAQAVGQTPTIAPVDQRLLKPDPSGHPVLMTLLGGAAVVLLAGATWFALPQLRDRLASPEPDSVEEPLSSELETITATLGEDGVTEPVAGVPQLNFRQAEIGPLVVDSRYALDITNEPGLDGDGRKYQLLLDGSPITEPSDQLPVFFPPGSGRFQLAVNIIAADSTISTTNVDIYISSGRPEPGYRANLASVRSAPENWPQALNQFDRLLAAGHDELKLSLSTRGEQDGLPFWNFYVDGFGDDRARAQDYCDQRGLGSDLCFTAVVDSEAVES